MSFNIPSLPAFDEGSLTDKKTMRRVLEYLVQLDEYVRYAFRHIGEESLDAELLRRIGQGGGDQDLIQRVEDAEGNFTRFSISLQGVVTAVNEGSLEFGNFGLLIKNKAGDVVFSKDLQSGDLLITGILRALGGLIGGFTITQNALHNGSSIVLSSDGYVQLGDLTITDDASFGPLLNALGGLALAVGGARYLVLGEGSVTSLFPLRAAYGLYIDPGNTTTAAPNAYIDPTTGRIYRSTNTSGGGSSVSAGITLGQTNITLGATVVLYGSHSGGTGPYTYAFAVSINGGAYTAVAGGGATRNYTPAAVGNYRFRLIVTDSAGSSDTAYSEYLTVSQSQSNLSVEVYANKASGAAPLDVTWTMVVSGGSGSHGYSMTIYKDGGYFDNTSSYTITRTLTQPGTYYASVQVTDLVTLETKAASGGYVTVNGGSQTQYARTTGTNVIMRSGPGTGYSEVTRIAASGTQVQITGSLQSGFYPVYWNGYSGYMSASYLQLI